MYRCFLITKDIVHEWTKNKVEKIIMHTGSNEYPGYDNHKTENLKYWVRCTCAKLTFKYVIAAKCIYYLIIKLQRKYADSYN